MTTKTISSRTICFILFCAISILFSSCAGKVKPDPRQEVIELTNDIIALMLARDIDGLIETVHPDESQIFALAMGGLERGLEDYWILKNIDLERDLIEIARIMFNLAQDRAAVEVRFIDGEWYDIKNVISMTYKKDQDRWLLVLDLSYID